MSCYRSILGAIIQRVSHSHLDLLYQHGIMKVTLACEQVAHSVRDVQEIGSSDVSIWVKQVSEILEETSTQTS